MDSLPTGFGKQERSQDQLQDDINARYKLYQRIASDSNGDNKSTGKADSDSDSDSSSDEDDDLENLPLSHQIALETNHTKQISSISLDRSGSRMISSSYDGLVNFFDFNSMDINNCTPFKSIEPLESHQIHQATFSANGSHILVIPRHSRAKLYSRDGKDLGEFARGDMYLVDMKNTKGHVSEITQAQWNDYSNSSNSKEFATAGFDSTVRIWDADKFNTQKSVIVMKPKKTQVTALGWVSNDSLACASMDGVLRLWDTRGSLIRPKLEVKDAHLPNTWTSCISKLSPESTMLITRGGNGDDTLKLWDTRQLKTPLLTRRGLLSTSEELSVVSCLEGKYLATASDHDLHILDSSDLMTVTSIHYDSPVTQLYHSQTLNQLFVGQKTGNIQILFSPSLSTKGGARAIIESRPRSRHIDDMSTANISLQGLNEAIIRQEKAQELRQEEQRRRQRDARNQNHTQASLPTKPNPGVWGTPTAEHIRDNVNLSEMNSEDPREALLKFADRAAKDPRFKHFKQDSENDNDSGRKKQRRES